MSLTLSAEEGLLVAAATPPGGSSRPYPVEGSLGWGQLTVVAERQRLSPLLWRYLCNQPDFVVPSEILDQLRRSATTTTARNLYLQAQLDLVLTALAGEAIPVMLLKGAALIEAVYPSIGLRPMDDLDLLVPRDMIDRAHSVVRALGYDVVGAELGRHDDFRLATRHHHYPLVKRGTGVVVELHHHVRMTWPRFEIAGFWERAVPGTGSVAHLRPSSEDLLLHVAVHFTVDRIERRQCALGQIADVAWIADRYPIDWHALAERARRYGVADRLFLALVSTSLLMDGVVPARVVSGLQPSTYRGSLGEHFVRQRVLRSRSAAPLERASEIRRLIFPDPAGLAIHVRPDDPSTPSRSRLYVRRALALGGKVMSSMARPRELFDDIRLSRWVRSLRS